MQMKGMMIEKPLEMCCTHFDGDIRWGLVSRTLINHVTNDKMKEKKGGGVGKKGNNVHRGLF